MLPLSQKLLLATKKKEDTQSCIESIASLTEEDLLQLDSDEKKLVFWINLYNAHILIALRTQGDNPSTSGNFFTRKHIRIAGQKLSFDDVEHQIIRGGKIKYGLGWIPTPFPKPFLKKHRVSKLDYRIHFALNCGAKSCPPIAYYELENLNEQLEMATENYLNQETYFEEASNTLWVSKLFFWYMGDFGGKKGTKKILQQYRLYPTAQSTKIKFADYDWAIKENWGF